MDSDSKVWTRESRAMVDIVCGGLIATGLIVLQALMSANSLDIAEFVSILAFAVAIPVLSGKLIQNFMIKQALSRFPKKGKRRWLDKYKDKDIIWFEMENLYFLAVLTALVGVGAAFWHVSWIAGVVFVVSSIIAFFDVQRIDFDKIVLEEDNIEESKEE